MAVPETIAGKVTKQQFLDHALDINNKVLKTGGDTITASGAAVVPLTVKGAASQTANLAEFQDNAGTVLAKVLADGAVETAGGLLATNGGGNTGFAAVFASPGATTNKGLIVRGAASQTANLAEFQNSAGTVLAGIDNTGRNLYPAAIRATTATAGTAGGPPAQVAGYILANNNAGAQIKIPFYNT